MNLKIKIITSADDFFNLESEWKNFELKINNKNITSSFTWLKTWWEVFEKKEDNSFGYNKKLLIILLYKNEELIAIAPLIKLYRKKRGIKIYYIEFLAQQWGATYLDFIANELSQDKIEYIFNWLYKNEKFDILQLKYIPEYTKNFNLKNSNCYILSGCPQINLSNYNGFNDYQKQIYSKSLKQNIRTAYNRLQKASINYSEKIESLNKINIESIIRLSKSKLIDNKHSIYLDKEKLNFIIKSAEIFQTKLFFILFNNIEVAYRLYFVYNNNIFSFDASYNREYKNYELGSLSMDFSMKDSFMNKYKSHCEGTGIDLYKLKFLKKVVKIYTYLKKGNTFKSILLYKLLTKSAKKIEEEFVNEYKKLPNQ